MNIIKNRGAVGLFLSIFCFYINFLEGSGERLKFSFLTEAGFDSNSYNTELETRSSYPVKIKTDFDYFHKYMHHSFGVNNIGSFKYYTKENNQNALLYNLSPYYTYKDYKKIEFKLNYAMFKDGRLSTNIDRKYINFKGNDFKADISLNPIDSGFFLNFSLFRNKYEYSIKELDYLDRTKIGLHSEIKFYYYPRSALIIFLDYFNSNFNKSPSKSYIENDYKLLSSGLGWKTNIGDLALLKLLVYEKFYKFIGNEKRLSTNFEIYIENKLFKGVDLYTRFDYINKFHRSSDALIKLIKSIEFGTEFVTSPTIFGNAGVSYSLISYSKPYKRDELDFSIFTKIVSRLTSKVMLYSKYSFNFVVSDKVGLNEYMEEILTVYSKHEIFIGMQYKL